MSEDPPVLVIGSYPPVDTPGSAATLAEVRRLLGAGRRVVVVSPRPSAATHAVAVTGPLAGRRLRHLAAVTGARDLVICAEQELPVPLTSAAPAALGGLQRLAVATLVRAASGFDSFTLIIGDDLGLPAPLEARLRRAAGAVVDRRGESSGRPGVTVLGPGAHSPVVAARVVAGKVARRVLAPLPAPLRNAAYAAARAALARSRSR